MTEPDQQPAKTDGTQEEGALDHLDAETVEDLDVEDAEGVEGGHATTVTVSYAVCHTQLQCQTK